MYPCVYTLCDRARRNLHETRVCRTRAASTHSSGMCLLVRLPRCAQPSSRGFCHRPQCTCALPSGRHCAPGYDPTTCWIYRKKGLEWFDYHLISSHGTPQPLSDNGVAPECRCIFLPLPTFACAAPMLVTQKMLSNEPKRSGSVWTPNPVLPTR